VWLTNTSWYRTSCTGRLQMRDMERSISDSRKKSSPSALVAIKRLLCYPPARPQRPLPVTDQRPLRVKGGCGRQANGTAGLPPAPEIPVRSGTHVSCQQKTSGLKYPNLTPWRSFNLRLAGLWRFSPTFHPMLMGIVTIQEWFT
jgi:hypothetical protein